MNELKGNDESGNGSVDAPYLSVFAALQQHSADANVLVLKDDKEGYAPVSQAAMKKAKKRLEDAEKKRKKAEEQQLKASQDAEAANADETRRLEESKSIKLVQDSSLPAAQPIKIRQATSMRGKRVRASGWVHRMRTQGKDMRFVVLRDGSGYLQCVMTGAACQTFEALTLTWNRPSPCTASSRSFPPARR